MTAPKPPRWRVGHTSGRTLYRDEQSVGRCDTPDVAAEIVQALNSVAAPSGVIDTETERHVRMLKDVACHKAAAHMRRLGADCARYSDGIGVIERALGHSGPRSLQETVLEVGRVVAERDAAKRELDGEFSRGVSWAIETLRKQWPTYREPVLLEQAADLLVALIPTIPERRE